MARGRTYSSWVAEVAEMLEERGLSFSDYSNTWFRQQYEFGDTPEDTVSALVSENTQRGSRRGRGRVCIDRAPHQRRAFTRTDGTRVRATTVPASRFCVRDRGTPGVRSRGAEQGPFKNEAPFIQRSGDLGGPGFSEKSERERRRLLRSSVERFGYRSTLGKVSAILRNTEVRPNVRRTLESDRRWLVDTFGGPGSFGGRTNRQLGSGRYEVLTDAGPEARYFDREEAIREAARLGKSAMVFDTRSDRLIWQASRSRRRFQED